MAIQIELPVPFPLGSVNAWLFPGDRPVLVDCGIGGTFEELVKAIRDAGVDPKDLHLHLSHGHVDHAGNARPLKDHFGVPLIAPASEAPYVETFRQDADHRNDQYDVALRAHGMPHARADHIRSQSHEIDQYLEDASIDERPESEPIFGNDVATTLPTPGHTPGSTCWLLDEAIITGDTLLERITSNAVELKDDDKGAFHQYVQTLDSMRQYVGMKALPGHRAPFQITDAVLDHHLERHESRRQRILALLDRPKTAWHLMPEIFPGLNGDDHHFMGMSEIVGHLHSMEIDGIVGMHEREGVRHWTR